MNFIMPFILLIIGIVLGLVAGGILIHYLRKAIRQLMS
jgi:hypothetical protein